MSKAGSKQPVRTGWCRLVRGGRRDDGTGSDAAPARETVRQTRGWCGPSRWPRSAATASPSSVGGQVAVHCLPAGGQADGLTRAGRGRGVLVAGPLSGDARIWSVGNGGWGRDGLAGHRTMGEDRRERAHSRPSQTLSRHVEAGWVVAIGSRASSAVMRFGHGRPVGVRFRRDVANAELVIGRLQHADWAVRPRRFEGPSAVKLGRQVDSDLVVLDLGLPRMDGVEVRSVLRTFSDCYRASRCARRSSPPRDFCLDNRSRRRGPACRLSRRSSRATHVSGEPVLRTVPGPRSAHPVQG